MVVASGLGWVLVWYCDKAEAIHNRMLRLGIHGVMGRVAGEINMLNGQ